MKIRIAERDRRALLGLLVILGLYLVLVELALPAYDKLTASSEGALEKEDQLRKSRRALQRKGNYAQLLDQARKQTTEAEARLIRGDNPSLASSELQTLIEEAAAAVGIELGQRNMSPARKRDNYFNEITVTTAWDCTPGQLVNFLNQLRASPKHVTVRSIQIAPVQVAQEPPKRGKFEKTLRVNITIGAVLSSAPAASAAARTNPRN